MSIAKDVITTLNETALELAEEHLRDTIERDSDNKLTYCQYELPLCETAQPEHIQEIDDAIRRALKLGWNPELESDPVCRYSYFLWNAVESSYLHRRADEIQKEIQKE